jgi:hypothetical protein
MAAIHKVTHKVTHRNNYGVDVYLICYPEGSTNDLTDVYLAQLLNIDYEPEKDEEIDIDIIDNVATISNPRITV